MLRLTSWARAWDRRTAATTRQVTCFMVLAPFRKLPPFSIRSGASGGEAGPCQQKGRRKMTPADAYQDDLAYIHDAGFGGFARGSAPGLLTLFRRNGITGGLVVDLGCGSGIWANELAGSGYQVLGVDISP